MGLNRDKFRKIVGGITTEPEQPPKAEPAQEAAAPPEMDIPTTKPAGQGVEAPTPISDTTTASSGDSRRFAKRGRPKGRKDDVTASKTRKVKVSLFLSETLVNDFYEWAHADRLHPGEMFERALKPYHEKEVKRRNAGKE